MLRPKAKHLETHREGIATLQLRGCGLARGCCPSLAGLPRGCCPILAGLPRGHGLAWRCCPILGTRCPGLVGSICSCLWALSSKKIRPWGLCTGTDMLTSQAEI
jgi:hypothetical protein